MSVIAVEKNVNLKNLNTLKIGGRASFFVSVKSAESLISALLFAKKKKLKVFILGEGSNVLFSNKGFNGLVIKFH